MSELQQSLNSMNLGQYLLAVAFIICYALVLGNFLGPRLRLKLAGLACLCAIGFALLSRHWVHGVLMIAFLFMGMGLFIGLAWLLKLTVSTWQSRALHGSHAPDINTVQANFPYTFSASGKMSFDDAYSLVDEHAIVDHARG
jgi:hypothetical protein